MLFFVISDNFNCFAVDVKAYDKVWIISDGFMNNTFNQYFTDARSPIRQTRLHHGTLRH